MYRGELIEHYPASLKAISECEAVYEELPGWTEDITGARTLEDLPENAQTLCKACFPADRYSNRDLLRWS